jgi:hypothetical protein
MFTSPLSGRVVDDSVEIHAGETVALDPELRTTADKQQEMSRTETGFSLNLNS